MSRATRKSTSICIARSVGRARIETWRARAISCRMAGIARSVGRARIETDDSQQIAIDDRVSPAQLGGRGLKHPVDRDPGERTKYRPLSWAGAD